MNEFCRRSKENKEANAEGERSARGGGRAATASHATRPVPEASASEEPTYAEGELEHLGLVDPRRELDDAVDPASRADLAERLVQVKVLSLFFPTKEVERGE
jgi:hypothetical protein